jgi:transcriptional regulator with XRE-family HTH domain
MSLRGMREAAGLSQEQLAARADLSQTLISQLELGKIPNPGTRTLRQIADALGVPLHDVIAVVLDEVA